MGYRINGHVLAIGSVSHGTLRAEDLGKEFVAEYRKFCTHIPECVRELEFWLEGDTESLRQMGWQESTSWDEIGSQLVNQVQDELMNLAPVGVYFGTTEGDASDFGWWETGEEDSE